MPDLKIRHTFEGLNRIIEAVRQHNSPELWITDLKDLNRVFQAAKALIAQLDKYHRNVGAINLRQAVANAEQPPVPFEAPGPWDEGPCGLHRAVAGRE